MSINPKFTFDYCFNNSNYSEQKTPDQKSLGELSALHLSWFFAVGS